MELRVASPDVETEKDNTKMGAEQTMSYQCIRCESFETNVASAIDVVRQMKHHLDVAHPYWDLEDLVAGSPDYKIARECGG